MRKLSNKSLCLAAAALTLRAGISAGTAMAYFTTYAEASGNVILNMGFTETKPTEEFSNWTKHLNLKEGSGWVIDKNASTKERTILYYTGILPAGKSTPALSDTLTIDGSIATKVKQDVTEKDGYKTITTTYAYDGYNFQLEAEADAVQTHNAQDAIKSAWGVDVDVDGNGNISLR